MQWASGFSCPTNSCLCLYLLGRVTVFIIHRCGNMNFARRTMCNRCGIPREGGPPDGGMYGGGRGRGGGFRGGGRGGGGGFRGGGGRGGGGFRGGGRGGPDRFRYNNNAYCLEDYYLYLYSIGRTVQEDVIAPTNFL